MRNPTFNLLAGSLIDAGQYVLVDQYTRRIVPTDDIAQAIGRAVSSASPGGRVEVSPLLNPHSTGKLTDFNELSMRIYRLEDLELEHARER